MAPLENRVVEAPKFASKWGNVADTANETGCL